MPRREKNAVSTTPEDTDTPHRGRGPWRILAANVHVAWWRSTARGDGHVPRSRRRTRGDRPNAAYRAARRQAHRASMLIPTSASCHRRPIADSPARPVMATRPFCPPGHTVSMAWGSLPVTTTPHRYGGPTPSAATFGPPPRRGAACRERPPSPRRSRLPNEQRPRARPDHAP